jgi:heterodisulfide reductase subunit A-like polyferredoxin
LKITGFIKMTDHIMKKQSNYSCDVLIIGGGSAGLRAALEAHDAGANVLIISTSKKETLIQHLQEAVSMQLLALWIQRIIG